MQSNINANNTNVAEYRLNANPPCTTGLSRKSPTTAPNSLVSTKAAKKAQPLKEWHKK
jgi:hypothetical protein